MSKIWLTYFVCTILPVSVAAQFQSQYNLFEKSIILEMDSAQVNYALPDSFLVYHSENLTQDGSKLIAGIDYQIDYVKGKISFLKRIPASAKIKIDYWVLPLQLKQNYFHRQALLYKRRSEIYSSAPLTKTQSSPIAASPASTLEQNGSLVRGITLGTNQGMKLESGLRMQISGKVADKIEVVAALTDQNTPIQPEGNTQSLQEIDKVFVQLKSDFFQATLGDYYFELSGTEFSPYTRKLQGIMGTAQLDQTTLTLSGAVSKGRFTTNQFLGQEGNQGPYQLKGDRGQIDIIVLAGTEKVWIDGDVMTRGEENDYIIEYSSGQIEFTRHRLITADSRITVDFQYTDLKFQRSLYSSDLTTPAWNDKLKLGVRYLREADNKDNPLDFTLTDNIRQQLARTGDAVDSASVPGVKYVGAGKGYYVQVDSAHIVFYRYVGAETGDYNLSLSYVGSGNGDYKMVGYNHFSYVGSGKGSYQPIVLIKPAQSHDLLDVSLGYTPSKSFGMNAEMALSRLDLNLYSAADDGDNAGLATTGGFRLQPDSLSVLGLGLGKIYISGKYRCVQNHFQYLSRTDEIEKNRKWDIADEPSNEEALIEVEGNYEPAKTMRLTGNWGENRKGDNFLARRWQAGSEINFQKFPHFNYSIESIQSRNAISHRQGNWIRQKGFAEYRVWKIKPTFAYLAEEKKENYSDSLKLGLRYFQITPGLKLADWHHVTISAGYTKRKQDNYSMTGFIPESEATTQVVSVDYDGVKDLAFSMQYTHRERSYADSVGLKKTDLADVKLNYSPFRRAISTTWHYQLSNTQVAREEKIYIKVERGQGNYRFDESLNEYVPDALTGDYLYRVRATDEFIPVIELRASSTINFQPALLWQIKKNRPEKLAKWKSWLSSLSTETVARLEEKTRDEDVWAIYRLNLSHYQREEVSIYGIKNLRQDIYWNRNRSNFSVRLRYDVRQNLNNQYLEGGQRFHVFERQMRIDGQISKKFSTQINLGNRHEEKLYQISGRSDKDILSNEVSVDFSYRPRQQLELACKGQLTIAKNRAAYPLEVNFFSLTPRVNYAFRGKGRVRGEVELNQVEVTPKEAIVPYEMVSGYRGGTNLRWLASFDYNVSRYIRAAVSWNGRYEEYLGQAIYWVRAEMRAYF